MSVSGNHILGVTAIRPVERHGFEAIRYFIHDPTKGEFFMRTPKSWALILLFYLIYYTCLAMFWALMMFIFMQTVNYKYPTWQGEDGVIGISPGLGLRPVQTSKYISSSIITFNKDAKEDGKRIQGWGGWAKRSEEFLESYKNLTGTKQCTKDDPSTADTSCAFATALLGPCASEGHGYDVGKPCVFLKLNKIYGLKNDFYNDPSDLPDDMPQSLKDHIAAQEDKDKVWVDCGGEYPADDENLVEVNYFPDSRGLPSMYFPYQAQDNYNSPLVAVQFSPRHLGVMVHIECRAWAKNIGYSRRDRTGLVHLELLVMDDGKSQAVEEI